MSVPTVGHRFVLIVVEGNVLQQAVWNVLNDMPLDREAAIPLVLLPILNILVKIDRSYHLS